MACVPASTTPYPAARPWAASWPASRWLGASPASEAASELPPSITLFPATTTVGSPGLTVTPPEVTSGVVRSRPVSTGTAPNVDDPVPVNGVPVVSPVSFGVAEPCGLNQDAAPLAHEFSGKSGRDAFSIHRLTSRSFPAVTANGRASGSL